MKRIQKATGNDQFILLSLTCKCHWCLKHFETFRWCDFSLAFQLVWNRCVEMLFFGLVCFVLGSWFRINDFKISHYCPVDEHQSGYRSSHGGIPTIWGRLPCFHFLGHEMLWGSWHTKCRQILTAAQSWKRKSGKSPRSWTSGRFGSLVLYLAKHRMWGRCGQPQERTSRQTY